MSLSVSDITKIKEYIKLRYSLQQLATWTNPDKQLIDPDDPTVSMDENVLSAFVESAYEQYVIYYSSVFSSDNKRHLELICGAVVQSFKSWRDDREYDNLKKYFKEARRGILKQQRLYPLKVEVRMPDAERDADSDKVFFNGHHPSNYYQED